MEIQKATGIVLHSRRIGEADVIVRAYTREYGKRNFIFKGIKKSRSRPLAATEPGTTVELAYYFHDNRDLLVVNDCRITAHTGHLRNDLEKILHLCYILETVDKTTGFNDPDAPMFDLLSAAIGALGPAGHPCALSAFFTLHVLRMHGVLPDYTRCRRCGKARLEAFSINSADFSPSCRDCTGREAKEEFSFGERTAEFIRLSLTRKFGELTHGRYPAVELLHLIFYLTLFVENYFRVEIKSKKMLLQEERR